MKKVTKKKEEEKGESTLESHKHQLKPQPVKIDDIIFFGCTVKFRVNYLVKFVKIFEHLLDPPRLYLKPTKY